MIKSPTLLLTPLLLSLLSGVVGGLECAECSEYKTKGYTQYTAAVKNSAGRLLPYCSQAEEFGKVRCEDSETYCVDFRVTTVYNKKAKLRYKEEYRFKGCSNITVTCDPLREKARQEIADEDSIIVDITCEALSRCQDDYCNDAGGLVGTSSALLVSSVVFLTVLVI